MNASSVIAALVALYLGGTAAAASTSAECRSGDGVISAPASPAVVVVVVDRTAARSSSFNAGVETAIAAAIRPNTRAVLWRFAGRAQPLPQLVLDTVTPALPATDIVDINVLARRMVNAPGHEERLQGCILARVQELRATFLSALRAELDTFDDSSGASSPILLALGQAVQPVAVQAAQGMVDVVMVTDGYEHAEASFYPVHGRYLTPNEGLAKTKALSPNLRGARVSIAGIGVVNEPVDTAGVTALTGLWRAILLARGATPVQITTGPPQQLRQ